MMISKTSKSLQDKNYITDLSTIKKFLEILALLLITFTIIFFTFFGCFLVLYDSTSGAAKGVTLNSEEPAEQGRAHLIRLCKSPLMGLKMGSHFKSILGDTYGVVHTF